MAKNNKITDRATLYALSVIDGEIIAGPFVRGACQRHKNDRDKADMNPEYPFRYDENDAAEAIAFIEECLCLNGGQYEGVPFLLLPWQAFVVGSIFGWKRKADGMRRFRVAFIETAKGSGKSPLCAAVGIKGLVADNEPRAEIYAAATYKDQAMVLFRDAVAFYDQSPELQERLVASGTGAMRWNLAYLEKGSFFRVISSEKKGQSGPRPHMALLDEIHEHKDGTVIEMLRAGFKFRRQPLSFMITNSGHDKTSVCWEYHDIGTKVSCEQEQNDEFFAYICSFDDEDIKDDRYLTDENIWEKVNPSIKYGLPGYDYIRGQVIEGRGLPSKMATVKRLCFCQWTESENPAISKEVWDACADKGYSTEILKGRRCWGGLDLSAVDDLTAFALIFEPLANDPFWRLKVWFWVPGSGLFKKADQDHVPYIAWRDAGYVKEIKNRASIEYEFVIIDVKDLCEEYDVQKIAFDRWNIKNFNKDLARMGVTLPEMVDFGQGYQSMSPAIKVFEKKLLDATIRHDSNPCLTWNAANVVADEDAADNKKYIKPSSGGRIDGIIAAVMACGIIEESVTRSAYDGKSYEEMKKMISLS